jgi:hypothetical protein
MHRGCPTALRLAKGLSRPIAVRSPTPVYPRSKLDSYRISRVELGHLNSIPGVKRGFESRRSRFYPSHSHDAPPEDPQRGKAGGKVEYGDGFGADPCTELALTQRLRKFVACPLTLASLDQPTIANQPR